MVPVTTFQGRQVILFGLGGSGLATAEALLQGGAIPHVWDDNPARVEAARAAGFIANDPREADWTRFAALILAPGVPLTHPAPHWTVELARKVGIEVIGDVELFARERTAFAPEAPLVAITGTNGKSTTTALIAHVLREAGRDVQMGGNIGTPILALEPASADRVHVIECSSYQIDLAPSLNPSIGVLLNITPDHLDRHGTFERYAAIKERLVAAAHYAVVGIDDEHSKAASDRLRRDRDDRDLVHLITGELPNDDVAETSIGLITEHDPDCIRYTVELGGIASLRGAHNRQNAAAALAVCEILGLDNEQVIDGFKSFPGLAHRMEQVTDRDGLTFVNDSKATNADAAAPALGSFPKVRWIAGGLPKDGGIEPLRPLFGHVERAYLIGEAAPQFAATLGDTVPYEISGTLPVAVEQAAAHAREAGGGVVLFSPAAASFDQFRNFEERGEAFRTAVHALEG